MPIFHSFWLGAVAPLLTGEIVLRLSNNRRKKISNRVKKQSSLKYAAVENVNCEPNMIQDDLKQLAFEYDEHVQRCVAHYGNWSSAIKSEDSMHMPDYKGQFLNVIDGLRVTTNHPAQMKQQFYVFGGSTVFCGEVSDNLTLCSQLQVLINKKNYSTTVINYGRHGSTFRNRLLFLERCDLRKDDLVLFWFGVNELGWKLLEGKTSASFFINSFHQISEGLKFFSKYAALVDLVSKAFDSAVLQPVYKSYAYFETRQSIRKLEKLSRLRGFRYKVMLQPNLLTKSVRTPREDLMLKYFLTRDKGRIIKKLLDSNYPRFKSLLRSSDFDASGLFKQSDREVFVDWVHLNSEGNRTMAEVIFGCYEDSRAFEPR